MKKLCVLCFYAQASSGLCFQIELNIMSWTLDLILDLTLSPLSVNLSIQIKNCDFAVRSQSVYFSKTKEESSSSEAMETFEMEDDSERPLGLRFLLETLFILNTFLIRHKPRALGLTLDFHLLSLTL